MFAQAFLWFHYHVFRLFRSNKTGLWKNSRRCNCNTTRPLSIEKTNEKKKKRQQQQRFTIKRCFRFTDDNNKGWVLFAGVLNMKCLCQGKSEKKIETNQPAAQKNDMYCYSFMSKPNHTSNLKLKFNPSEIWKIDQKMKFRQIFCHMQIVRELLIRSFRSCSSMNWTSCFGATHFLWITLANQLQIQ